MLAEEKKACFCWIMMVGWVGLSDGKKDFQPRLNWWKWKCCIFDAVALAYARLGSAASFDGSGQITRLERLLLLLAGFGSVNR